MAIYQVPREFFFPLHHPRPRFKNQAEEVLTHVASSIERLGSREETAFAAELNSLIRQFPGNFGKVEKTINNWRTEISTLFAMFRTENGWTSPTHSAKRLAKDQDLIEFFRHFLLTFQYPGGHVKSHEAAKMIERGVRFHPASTIIDVMMSGAELDSSGHPFGLSAAEVTHLIFNDLRVTGVNRRESREVALRVLKNRRQRLEYDRTGDVVRYAKDVLDYMRTADLLHYRPAADAYYINPRTIRASNALRSRPELFDGYEHLYGSSPTSRQVAECHLAWIDFVNRPRNLAEFEDDLEGVLGFDEEQQRGEGASSLLEALRKALSGSTKDIGMVGESLAIQHEMVRLARIGRSDLARQVKKIPDSFGVGYDIKSFEGGGSANPDSPLYVEVKTTRTRSRSQYMSFVLTPNEWRVCERNERYCVYRILLTPEGPSLFVIRNPHEQYVLGRISLNPTSGAEISFTEECGEWVELELENAAP